MNYASVVRILAFSMLLLAGGAGLPLAVALVRGEDAQVFTFIATALGIGVLAATVLVLTPHPSRKARPSDALAVIVLWWFLSPLAAALPFVVGVANASLLDAIHEAAACLTTTGQSVIDVAGNDWPASLIVWRGVLHLFGGVASIIMAASVLAALNLGGPGIHRSSLFTVPETSFFDSVPRVARSVGAMVVVTLSILFLALVFSGLNPARALEDAVGAVTTGLVHPETLERGPRTPLANGVLAVGLGFGALGLAVWLPLREGKVIKALADPETVLFVCLVGAFALFVLPLGLSFRDALAWSLTTLSTSGISLTSTPVHEIVPVSIFVLPALIGGSALSAAGGVKLARLIVLSRRAGQEFRQLGFRSSVLGFRFRDRELDERSVLGVWVYLIAYILSVFLVMVGFSFMDVPFESTIRLAIGSLTNSGALIVGHADDLSAAAEGLLIIAMIVGRLEILALLPVLSLSFWRG